VVCAMAPAACGQQDIAARGESERQRPGSKQEHQKDGKYAQHA
jgi:hypothetical protein